MSNLLELYNCYINTCEKELNKINKNKKVLINKISKLNNNNKLSLVEKKSRIKKLQQEYSKSNNMIKFFNCQLKNCHNLVKNHLDELAKDINYIKLDKYSMKDYIKIRKLYEKKHKLCFIL